MPWIVYKPIDGSQLPCETLAGLRFHPDVPREVDTATAQMFLKGNPNFQSHVPADAGSDVPQTLTAAIAELPVEVLAQPAFYVNNSNPDIEIVYPKPEDTPPTAEDHE